MTREYFVILAAMIASGTSIFYIPKKSYRLALVSFLICQVISWPQPILFVQIGYTAYPVRDFPHATGVNVSLLYLFFPMVFTWSMLLFPQKAHLWRKIVHYFIFASITVWFTYFISTYTDLMKFVKGTALFNVVFLYLRMLAYQIVCHLFIKWFSKRTGVLEGGLHAQT